MGVTSCKRGVLKRLCLGLFGALVPRQISCCCVAGMPMPHVVLFTNDGQGRPHTAAFHARALRLVRGIAAAGHAQKLSVLWLSGRGVGMQGVGLHTVSGCTQALEARGHWCRLALEDANGRRVALLFGMIIHGKVANVEAARHWGISFWRV